MADRVSMIHVRGGFSEAHGMGSCVTQLQFKEFDDKTRTSLYNSIYQLLFRSFKETEIFRESYSDETNYEDLFFQHLIMDVFGERVSINRLHPYRLGYLEDKIYKVFMEAPYNEVLDLVQYIIRWLTNMNKRIKEKNMFFELMNQVFEDEYVGYRFVDGKIAPITDKNEIISIENACNNEFEGTRAHVKKAVGFIADRERKDYKNCIKESISAVESICSIIAGQKKSSLDDALKNLQKNGVKIHPQLELAFSKLYAYTNSEKGIRHANGMFESDVTFEEAKFMLVSCSAFVNYLIANYGKVGGKHA